MLSYLQKCCLLAGIHADRQTGRQVTRLLVYKILVVKFNRFTIE